MLTIIGCGNPMRGDDGLGSTVVARLRERIATLGWSDVQGLDAGTDGMGVMFAARGSDALVIVDAAQIGSDAGTIYEVPGHVLARDYAPSLNLHDFRWEHALAAGRRMFRDEFPAEVTVLLVQVERIDFGSGLSPVVRLAADSVGNRIFDIACDYRKARLREPV